LSDDRDTLNTIITDALEAAGVDPTVVDRADIIDQVTQRWQLVPNDGDLNITITDTEWHHVATGITVRFQPS
jgi:hypothetical protein